MTRGDKLLLLAILVLAAVSAAGLYGRFFTTTAQEEPVQAVVTVQGKVLRTLELKPGTRSTVNVAGLRGPSTLELDGTRVRMLKAPCENGICVKQGWIGHAGQSIVCVPGEIVIKMEGAAAVDAVTR